MSVFTMTLIIFSTVALSSLDNLSFFSLKHDPEILGSISTHSRFDPEIERLSGCLCRIYV